MKEIKGFTGIPNDLLEALFGTGLSANDMRVVLAIARYTYGYRRDFADMSAQFIANATGLRRDVAGRCVRSLVKCGIVKAYKTDTSTSPKKLGINTNFDEWSIAPAVCKDASSCDADASACGTDDYSTYGNGDCRQTENANSSGDTFVHSTYDTYDTMNVDNPAHQDINNNKIINKSVINKTFINEVDPYDKDIVMIKILYETTCISFEPIGRINHDKAKKIKLLLGEFTEDEIKRGFEMAEASPYLKGQNSSNWKANFDWIVNPANMSKILSGKYKTNSRCKDFDADFDPDEYFRIAVKKGMEEAYQSQTM